jgi:AcrR family transcriptional regulator
MPKQTFFNLPDDKRELLVQIALEEFAANDYEVASLSKIVARAGISKGSAYQYFEDKADLYMYLLAMGRQQKSEYMARRSMPEGDLDMFTYLRWLLEEMTVFELANPLLAQLSYRMMRAPSAIKARVIGQAQADTRTYFVKLIRQAMKQGSVRKDVDPHVAGFLFSAVFAQLADFLIEQDTRPDTRSLKQPTMHTKKMRRAFDQVMSVMQFGLAQREMKLESRKTRKP